MASSTSTDFSLQERSLIATALVRLRSEGTAASGPISSVLSEAVPQLTVAASSGRQASLDAAHHVPAILSLLAEFHEDIPAELSEAVASAAMLLVGNVASRMKPPCLADTLCGSHMALPFCPWPLEPL